MSVWVELLSRLCLYSEPLDRPQNFELDNSTLTSTSADFTWDPVDQSVERVRGFFKGYQVLAWLLVSEVFWTFKNLNFKMSVINKNLFFYNMRNKFTRAYMSSDEFQMVIKFLFKTRPLSCLTTHCIHSLTTLLLKEYFSTSSLTRFWLF